MVIARSNACTYIRGGEDVEIAKTLESGGLRQQQILLNPSSEAIHDMRLRLISMSGDTKFGVPVLPYSQIQFMPASVDFVSKSISKKAPPPSQSEEDREPPAPRKKDPLDEEKQVANQNRIFVHPSKRRLPGGRVIPVKAYAKNKRHRWARENASVKRRVGSFGWSKKRVIKRSLDEDSLYKSLLEVETALIAGNIESAGVILEKSGELVQRVIAGEPSEARTKLIGAYTGLTADFCDERDAAGDMRKSDLYVGDVEEDLYIDELNDFSKSGPDDGKAKMEKSFSSSGVVVDELSGVSFEIMAL
jgi:hypothetical protein